MLSFAAPLFLLGLLLLPVVALLHFIRRAKRERVVSALWLWGEEEAPSRRARFNPNLLLLLQLLTVLFASFGAARPIVNVAGREVAVIVDASASMTAVDVTPSRLDASKLEASRLLGGASRGVVVRAGLAATLAGSGSRDASLGALERVVAGDSTADLEGAVALARSVAPNAELHLFTSLEPPPNFNGTLHRVLGSGENVGITAFALRGKQVFAALESNSVAPKQVKLTLERDGKPVLTNTIRVPGGSRAIWTPKLETTSGTYKLAIDAADALMLDNTAYASVSSVRVLVSPPQDDVLRAVVSVPGVRAVVQDVPPSTPRGFDVVVLVGAVPKTLPPGQYIVFAPLPPERLPRGEVLNAFTRVTRADATDALLRFASLDGVRVRLSRISPPQIPDGSWRPVAFAGETPFIHRGEGGGVRAVFIASHPLESDLRSLPAFPVMIYNALQEFAGATTVPLGSSLGENEITFNGSSAPGVRQALLPGVYEIGRQRIVANLASSAATKLVTGKASVQELGKQTTQDRSSATPSGSSAALWLLALALIALLLEAFVRGGYRFGGVFARRAA
jgi:Ca-activated chloride channel homolog